MRSVVILAAVLSGALLYLGSVTDGGLATALALTAAWACYVAALRQRAPRGMPIRVASCALWGAACWCLLQLVPLPASMLALLSPRAAEIWKRADLLVGLQVSSHPLSVDPPATMFAATTAIVVALAYEASARYASHRDARFRLLLAVVVAVLLLDMVALAHRAAGVTRVFGAYTPRYPTSHGLLSPLLNPNHTAAVACVAPPLLIGMSLGRPAPVRIAAAVGIVVSGAVAALSISRSGMLVFGLELGVMAVYLLSRRGDVSQRSIRGALVGIAAIGTVLAVMVAASDPVMAEARKTDVSKLRVPLRALSLARDYLITGAGRGSFGSVFPAYEGDLPVNARYMHVEDWPVQLACDMGLFAAGAYVAALGTAAVLARNRILARPPYVGALVALGGLVVHDLVDFSMEFAGTAMLAAVLLAVVTTTGMKTSSQPQRERLVLPALAGIASLVGAGLLSRGWNRRADDEQQNLQARLQGGAPATEVAAEAQAAITRHPADPYFPGLVGSLRVFEPAAGSFLVRSIELAPNRPTTHIALAHWFALAGRKPQSYAELRAALRLDRGTAPIIVGQLVRLNADVDELLAVVDDNETGDLVSAALERAKRYDDQANVDAFVIASFPPAIAARARQIERMRQAGRLDEARTMAADLRLAAPTSPQAWLASASLAPNDEEAEGFLVEGIRRTGKDLVLVGALTRRRAIRFGLAAVPNDLAEYQNALERAGHPAYEFHAFKAQVEVARKHPSAAIRYYLDAAAAAPESVGFIEEAAALAEQTGQTNMAQALWSRLLTMRPENPRYREKVQGLRPVASASVLIP